MKIKFIFLMWVCTSCSVSQLNQSLSGLGSTGKAPLTSAEVAEGLKEALTKGISTGADQVSRTDGYFKNGAIRIPFPPDVKQVEEKLRQIGLGGEVDNFILALNRGAEEAAKEAKPVFIDAIRQMTIEDAFGILKGEKDAATQYLQRMCSAELKSKFNPIIRKALNKTSATKYYNDLVNTYNKIPLVDKVNPNLDEYATNKAIQGLFLMIAQEEMQIRDNPAARTTDLLRRVFGS